MCVCVCVCANMVLIAALCGCFAFGAALVAIQSGLRLEDIWDSAMRFDLSP